MRRLLRVTYALKDALRDELLGTTNSIGTDKITLPHYIVSLGLYCTSIRESPAPGKVSPTGGAASLEGTNIPASKTEHVLLDCMYTQVPFTLVPAIDQNYQGLGRTPLVTEDFDGATEFITLPEENLFWPDGSALERQGGAGQADHTGQLGRHLPSPAHLPGRTVLAHRHRERCDHVLAADEPGLPRRNAADAEPGRAAHAVVQR